MPHIIHILPYFDGELLNEFPSFSQTYSIVAKLGHVVSLIHVHAYPRINFLFLHLVFQCHWSKVSNTECISFIVMGMILLLRKVTEFSVKFTMQNLSLFLDVSTFH